MDEGKSGDLIHGGEVWDVSGFGFRAHYMEESLRVLPERRGQDSCRGGVEFLKSQFQVPGGTN